MCLNTFLKILVCLFVDLENKKPALRLVLTRNKQLRYSVKHLECINFAVTYTVYGSYVITVQYSH
ncbi:hypothetical protein PS1M3_33580 [Pseudoalteromonas sp. PS1M3]|nr:hypothetical protein PS1M3_33580 [Pseudoalteromonas sp. PS1M3]